MSFEHFIPDEAKEWKIPNPDVLEGVVEKLQSIEGGEILSSLLMEVERNKNVYQVLDNEMNMRGEGWNNFVNLENHQIQEVTSLIREMINSQDTEERKSIAQEIVEVIS